MNSSHSIKNDTKQVLRKKEPATQTFALTFIR